MCGIAGVVALDGRDPTPGIAARMRERLIHRGPDGTGDFDAPGISLAACRLAIVDLEPRGLMPMAAADGRYRIVFNGEIYNRLELRDELIRQGVALRTTTDTEVVVELFAREGERMLDRLDGMFAFAIWDARERQLFAARDRCGEKPLFYALHEGRLVFASEPKALWAAGVPCRFETQTWTELLTFRSVAGERTPYVGVSRLLPGGWLRAGPAGVNVGLWWTFPTEGPPVDTRDFGQLLEASVRRRLIADVPVGALLSGGLDSSSVTALAARLSTRPLPAFTVRYTGSPLDEGVYAEAAARRAGVDHHHIHVSDAERVELLVDAAWHMDEPMPFGASAEMLAVSRYAQRHVRVLLTGEAADEVLGGYTRLRLYRYQRLVSLAGPLLSVVRDRLRPGSRWQRVAAASGRRRADWIALSNADSNIDTFTSAPLEEWAPYRAKVVAEAVAQRAEPVAQALVYERLVHLPSVLAIGDRLTMAAGLEARLPFTDPRILELGALATPGQLFKGPHGKQPLRAAMAGILPTEVLARRKRGWTGPFNVYLRDEPRLRAWLERVPDHEVVASSPLGHAGARRTVRRFLDEGKNAQLAWMLGRVVLWHQVCVEGNHRPFDGRAQ